MKSFLWLAGAGAGFGVMAWSYFSDQRIDPAARRSGGVMVVPRDDVEGEPEGFAAVFCRSRPRGRTQL